MLVTSKNLKYNQDGTGRDQYIYMDNGGYYPRLKETILLKDPGNFHKSPYRSSPASSLMQRPKRYVNNGTGRDSYIYCNDGGYCPGSTKAQFVKTLRSATLSPARFTKKTFNRSQDMHSTIALMRDQMRQSTRLALPKGRVACREHSEDNPQEQSCYSNYEMRQTTKWQSKPNTIFGRKELLRLINNKTARH